MPYKTLKYWMQQVQQLNPGAQNGLSIIYASYGALRTCLIAGHRVNLAIGTSTLRMYVRTIIRGNAHKIPMQRINEAG